MAFKKDDVIIIEPKEMFVGRKDAPVTLMEFGEYESEECAKANEVVKQLLEEYEGKIRFQFRHFPLTLIHQRSLKASESAVAAGQEGKFWEMHDKLYETQSSWGEVTSNQQSLFEGYAQELGLDMTKFKQDYVSKETSDRINRDISSGNQFKITGTPTFIVNGEKIELPGYQDKGPFEKILNEAITKAGGTVPNTSN